MTEKNTKKFDELEKKVCELNCRLHRIEELLNNIYNNTERMDTHINFVENVYSGIKSPLFNILGFFNSMIPSYNLSIQTNEKRLLKEE